MNKRLIFPVMLVCLLALSSLVGVSCTSFQVSGVEVAQQASSGDVLGSFDIKVNVVKFLGSAAGSNLFNVSSDATDPKIVDAVKAEVAKLGGSRAINVKIVYQASFINLLLNSITGFIYAPATAHVTGTVIK
ncbi:MAG: hypothetical protein LBH43_04305 [Treponema sp.]|jgi:hypothetical protein|nr:hypothetical protein [Treponema sp.]